MDSSRSTLTRQPFRPTPDTSLYCPTSTHEAAFTALLRTLSHHGGVGILEGEPGTGKTLLGLKCLEAVSDQTQRVMLQAPVGMSATEFFQAMLFDLGHDYHGQTEHELRLKVHGELLNALSHDRPVAILIDEAQNLSPAVLEEIRLFGNLESKVSKAVFVLLLGQPSLRELLAKPALMGFQQRLSVRTKLLPLNREESIRFLRHQIRACGGRPEWVMTEEAMGLLADHSQGLPRMLNRSAYLAMQIAESAGVADVDAEAVLEALQQLELVELPTADPEAADILPMNQHSGRSTPEPRLHSKPAAKGDDGPVKRSPAKKPKRKLA